jgi:CrcB protein
MYNVILVGLGGFVGSVGRYLTYLLVSTYFNHSFPIATLLVNAIGCFAIGALSATVGHYVALSNPRILLLLTTGIIGGFTTFSAFGLETVELLRLQPTLAVLNILGNILVGIGAVVGGRLLATAVLI